MKRVYESVGHLDKKMVSKFCLSEDLLMEHAALSLSRWIRKKLKKGSRVQILCGAGNNGADGLACARMLAKDYKISILLPYGVKSKMAMLQLKRLKSLCCVDFDKKVKRADAYIDALFGSGLNRDLDKKAQDILEQINAQKALKIACDVPSGIRVDGGVSKVVFRADETLSMGALNLCLFGDLAKDFVGKIKVCDLGLSSKFYRSNTHAFLLQKKDLKLPFRKAKNTNKGDFGHLVVFSGDKKGASLLSAKAGFAFGAGLVSVLGGDDLPEFLMSTKTIPKNATALTLGMGLEPRVDGDKKGRENSYIQLLLNSPLSSVLDAGILSSKSLGDILSKKENLILTPHPKEFCCMLKHLGLADISVEEVQKNRFDLAYKFSQKFPQVLVLKGANTIIAYKGKIFISTFGSSALAKGGSGDVLAGLIGSLLAQKYPLLDSAINGVLAHGLASKRYLKNNYSLFPDDIIEEIKCL